jgi:hypothetical protein
LLVALQSIPPIVGWLAGCAAISRAERHWCPSYANLRILTNAIAIYDFDILVGMSRGVIMYESDGYLIRVTSPKEAAGLFIWELCRGDGGPVVERSPKTFPTRIEALFDSARNASALEFMRVGALSFS